MASLAVRPGLRNVLAATMRPSVARRVNVVSTEEERDEREQSERRARALADELAALFRRFGEEPFAGRIARAVVEALSHGLTNKLLHGPTQALHDAPSPERGELGGCAGHDGSALR